MTLVSSGPRLYVISRPNLDMSAVEQFLSDEGTSWRRERSSTEAEIAVELAGRLCYFSFGDRQSPRTNAQYLQRLIDEGHESVLEHATWSFILTGVSRAFSHQLVRHRIGFSFSQLSQQYHDERNAPVVAPSAIRANPAAMRTWSEAVARAQSAYEEIDALTRTLNGLPAREHLRRVRTAARSVLPAATETKVFFSANARSIRHFLKVRGDIAGDEEMRDVTGVLLRTMQVEAPRLVADFRLSGLTDGSPVVQHVGA